MGRPQRGVLEGPKVGLERWVDSEIKSLRSLTTGKFIFGLLRNKLLQDDVVSFPVSLVSM